MGLDGSGDLILRHPAIAFMSTQFPEMYPSPGPVAVGLGSKVAPESTLEPFGAAGWDHQGDLAGAFPEFGSGLMAMVPCFTGAGFPQPIAANCANGLVDHCWDHERRDAGDCRGKKRKNMSGCGTSSSHSSLNRTENTDCEQPKGASSPSLPNSPQGDFEMKKDGRRRRSEKNPGAGARKPGAKQGKDHRQNGEDGKEDYVHIRAKRGQATNSHSLAERVRREKISERMRFLQNLVPGCNKITGKAVMLDEIINYVQSLQRQVEFLSMKLAAVSPELNFDIVHLLSKDMLHSGGGCEAAIDFGAGMNSSTCHSSGFASQSAILPEMFFHGISTTPQTILGSSHISQISPIPQMQANSWDEELHKAMQMGYIPHMSAGNSNVEPPGNHERSAGDP